MERRVNVLVGVKPSAGSEPYEDRWKPQSDPLFSEALPVIESVIRELSGENQVFTANAWTLFFKAQMAYLLLWSAIERYASLRYHLGQEVHKKVINIASEAAFQEGLRMIDEERQVTSAADPSSKYTLSPVCQENSEEERLNKATKAIQYYYQVRCNIAHRGKAGSVPHRDFQHVQKSLRELCPIFRQLLDAAFRDADF